MPQNKVFSEGASIVVAAVNSVDQSTAKYVCNGVADDVDIQTAIDELPVTGGKVLLLDGSYETIVDITIPTAVVLEGCGWGTIIKPDGAAITQGIILNGDYGGIKNLKVEMQAGVGTGGARPNAIQINGGYHNVVDTVWAHGDSTEVDDGSDERQNGLYMYGCGYNIISKVHTDNNDRHGICIDSTATENIIQGCISEGNITHGMYLIDAYSNTIVGCQLYGNSEHGMYIYGSWYNSIQGNVICDNTIDGINMLGDGTRDCVFNTITGNVINGNNSYGIYIDGGGYTNYNVVENNQLHNNTTDNFVDLGNETQAYIRVCDHFNTILAVTDNTIVNNEDLSAGLPLTFTIAAQPDVARTITWKFDSHAQITAFTITIIGVNARGKAITQVITEANGWTGTFDEAYATITSIIMSTRTGNGAADTMDIGVGGSVGLSNMIKAIGDVYKVSRNNGDYSGGGNRTPEATYATVDLTPGAGIVAADDYDIYYLVNKNQVK